MINSHAQISHKKFGVGWYSDQKDCTLKTVQKYLFITTINNWNQNKDTQQK